MCPVCLMSLGLVVAKTAGAGAAAAAAVGAIKKKKKSAPAVPPKGATP